MYAGLEAKKEGVTVYRHKKFRFSSLTNTEMTTETTRDRFEVEIPPKGAVDFKVPPGALEGIKILNIARKAPSTPSPFAPRKPN